MKRFFGARWKGFWEQIRDRKVGDIYDQAKLWVVAVEHGADPIEAMHGHLCGPQCMHWEALSAEQKAKLRKAPWNQVSKG